MGGNGVCRSGNGTGRAEPREKANAPSRVAGHLRGESDRWVGPGIFTPGPGRDRAASSHPEPCRLDHPPSPIVVLVLHSAVIVFMTGSVWPNRHLPAGEPGGIIAMHDKAASYSRL